jgi:hypothetical protein
VVNDVNRCSHTSCLDSMHVVTRVFRTGWSGACNTDSCRSLLLQMVPTSSANACVLAAARTSYKTCRMCFEIKVNFSTGNNPWGFLSVLLQNVPSDCCSTRDRQ